jgi:ribosomal protein L5
MISQKSHVFWNTCSSKKSGYKNQNLICRRLCLLRTSNKQSLREEFEFITKNPICAKYYQNIISQDLCLKQNYKNIMELASFQQIACNTSSKNYTLDRESILPAVAALEMITGQKPKPTCAKKSISSFKLRQSQLLGCKTSLRGEKMYEFLEKYISIQPTLTEKKPRDVRHNKKQSSDANYYQGKAILNRGRDYVILNCNVFPELQQHDELFQNVSGIQVSFSIKSRKKVNYKYPNSILLLSSAFQLL